MRNRGARTKGRDDLGCVSIVNWNWGRGSVLNRREGLEEDMLVN